MQSSLTSSFASAAAGSIGDSTHKRDHTAGSSDWSRSRVNGSQTFRRTSNQSRDNVNSSSASTGPLPSVGAYRPPHLNPNSTLYQNGVSNDTRYDSQQLLDVYKHMVSTGQLNDPRPYFAGPWDPSTEIDSTADGKELGPEVCWLSQPRQEPLALRDMDDREKDLFATSVNAPSKSNNTKDSSNSVGRKTSMSLSSAPGTGRPGARRRETSESFTGNGPLSPSESKTFFANDNTPPQTLARRRPDYIDQVMDKDEAKASQDDSPFAPLRRPGADGQPASAFNGAFSAFATDSANSDKRLGFGSTRGSSRFKDMLAQASSDDLVSSGVKDKQGFGALHELPEEDHSSEPAAITPLLKNRPNRSETNPYDDNLPRSGSAGIGGHEDSAVEQLGFSAFNHHDRNSSARTHEPLSPTNTNPYQSPQAAKGLSDDHHDGSRGEPSFSQRSSYVPEPRRQPSFGPSRNSAHGYGPAGNIPGWDNPAFGSGLPGRERPHPGIASAFGNPVFSPIGDMQSPGAAFGAGGFFGGPSAFGAPRSRLGPMFPPAMHDEMRPESQHDAFGGNGAGVRADPFDAMARRPDSFRGTFEQPPPMGPHTAFRGSPPQSQLATTNQSASPAGTDENSLPAAQQRQMVMPDRMRWVYRDPNGNVQGPWSGLEMHDWFKAGFFTAELQVKKVEDADYEPLAQLVRRIGNSREPFLVPQIGIPFGDADRSTPFSGTAGPAAGTAQPPFASSFPSFGTTLTADQQNALERRKQEEQFLMARQKEYLNQRHMQGFGPGPSQPQNLHNLQHHSSHQSLHSQPSFSSITSPGGFPQQSQQQQQQQAPAPIQPPHHMAPFAPNMPMEEVSSQFGRMNMDRGPFGMGPTGGQNFAAHERQRTQEARNHENTFLGLQGHNDRLEEFHELRGNTDEELVDEAALPQPIGSQRPLDDPVASKTTASDSKPMPETPEMLSLTQQVERTAAAQKQAREEALQSEVPPPSVSPLPAPAAQRRGAPVAETLAAESRSPAQTPVIESTGPSLAPWAEKTSELPRGPSLREIQAAEAKRAAEHEAILAAQRRAQAEQERLAAVALAASAPVPGLPTTSTWAASGSPATPTTPGGSAWIKPALNKTVSSTSTKKTLAQIQKEEAAQKAKLASQAAAAAQATAGAPTPATVSGNRYAQMASKTAPVPASSGSSGSAWTTIGGGGGKPKITTPTPPVTTTVRAVSTSIPATRPSQPTRAVSTALGSSQTKAKDELQKWAKVQLGKGLRSGINVDDFVRQLADFPPEIDLLSEAVYSSSDTLDGRRFAEEYIRRRKLAEKGIIEAGVLAESGSKGAAGGWSEVAKKGGAVTPKEEVASDSFKVVSKKKGKK